MRAFREVWRLLPIALVSSSITACSMSAGPEPIGSRLFAREQVAGPWSDAAGFSVEQAPGAEAVDAAGATPAPSSEPVAVAPEPEAIVDERPRPQRQWDHIASAAPADCRERLAQTKAKFQPLPDVEKPNLKGCGIPHGVMLSRGPTGIRYSPPVSIDCSLALELASVEEILQEEAAEHLGSPIASIGTLGSFACRGVIGRLKGWTGGISEHSFGNAVDFAKFTTEKGTVASVLSHYEPNAAEPKTAQGRFVRAVQRRIRHDAGLRALGPNFDASHRDHLHVDAGSPWWK